MFNIGLGAGLILIGLISQFLISKRLKHQGVRKVYSWIAWVCVIVGATKAASDIGNTIGASSAGAAIAAFACLMFIVADIADKRPDWLAFGLMLVTPALMRATGGPIGNLYDLMLKVPDAVGDWVGRAFGM
jgi:ABC-type Fe3+-siderophore transport system permease subunit